MTKINDINVKEKEEIVESFLDYVKDQTIDKGEVKLVNRINFKNQKEEEINNRNEEFCWIDITKDKSLIINDRKKHKKIFFFIVDALRLDFMVKKEEEIVQKEVESDSKRSHNNFSNSKVDNRNNENNENKKNNENNENKSDVEKTENEIRKKDENDTPTSSLPSSSSPFSSPTSPYNKFKNMHQLLKNNATQTAFFGFRADPPTVTSQRLKGGI